MPQRGIFFGNSRSVANLYEDADKAPHDPGRQALLYKELMETDPNAIIKRYEDTRYAKDKQCTLFYLCALYETRKFERIVPFILNSFVLL